MIILFLVKKTTRGTYIVAIVKVTQFQNSLKIHDSILEDNIRSIVTSVSWCSMSLESEPLRMLILIH